MGHLIDWCRVHLEEMEETAALFRLGQLRQFHLGRDISSGYAASLNAAVTELRELLEGEAHAPPT